MAYQSLTLATLKTRLAERYEGSPFWTAPEETAAINEGLRFLNLLTGFWKTRITLDTAASTWEYALPASMLYRMRVEYDGHPLSPSGLFDLDYGRPTWMTETTASGGDVPTRPTIWVPISLQLIAIWPSDAVPHHTLTLDGVANTPILVADGDYLDLGDEQVSLLLDYALHVLSFTRGGVWFQATMPALQRFLAAAAEENRLIKTSQIYRRMMGLDVHRKYQPLSDPEIPVLLGGAQ
jgi:hypothetical protein